MRGREEPLSGDRSEQRVQGLLPVVSIKELRSRARTATGQLPRSNRIMHQFWFSFKQPTSIRDQKRSDFRSHWGDQNVESAHIRMAHIIISFIQPNEAHSEFLRSSKTWLRRSGPTSMPYSTRPILLINTKRTRPSTAFLSAAMTSIS
jgi:hypothetical protein